jgi:hypothetical protein
MENIDAIITTKSMPKSLKPISKIEKGTHAILGNVNRPTANELIVLPKPGNFTITSPILPPITIESPNPAIRRHIVAANPTVSELFSNNSKVVDATEEGDGTRVCGYRPDNEISCQIPTKAARNKVALAASPISKEFLFLIVSSWVICPRTGLFLLSKLIVHPELVEDLSF